MRINRLQLVNIGPYSNSSWKFDRGLVGILGPNGAGKSTLVNAMYACLTNDFSRLFKTKEGAIHDMADPAEDAYVEMTVEHGGIEFELTRFLRPSKSYMKLKGKPPLRKAGEIQEKLEELMGLKRQLIDTYVFVEQNHMYGPFAQSDADRAKAFQYLCNTARAEEIWKRSGEMISDLYDVAALDLDDNRDALKDDISKRESRIAKNNKEIKKLQSKQLGEAAKAKVDQVIADMGKLESYRAQLVKAEEKLVPLLAKEKEAEAALDRARELYTKAHALVESQRDEAEAAASAIKLSEVHEKQQKQVRKLKKKIKALVDPPEPETLPGHTEQSRWNLRDAVAAHRSAICEAEKILEVFEEEGVVECPTCKTQVTELDDHLKAQQKIVDEYPSELEKLEAKLKAFEDNCTELTNWRKTVDQNNRDRKTFKEQLAEIEVVDPPEGTFDEWQETVAAWDEATSALDATQKYRGEMLNEAVAARTAAQAGSERVEELKGLIGQLKVGPKAYQRAQKDLRAHQEAEKVISNLTASNEALEEILVAQRGELVRKATLIDRAHQARQMIDRLERIREVSHRDCWPRIVAENYLEDIQDDMNKWLQGFGRPFRVRALDGLNFEFREPGCPWRASQQLSGGQKVVMALAFRRAFNLLFASEIGMMALDEPTENLDTQNVAFLRDGLRELAAANREAGNQIFIITHEEALEPAFDQVIEIAKVA